MEQIVVKTEVQANGEILLFYVDENEAQTVNIENQLLQMHEANDFEIRELEEGTIESAHWAPVQTVDPAAKDKWSDEDVNRLLVFYIDNKDTFVGGTTKKKHLWSVACKTMLLGKTPQTCELKLRNLKRKYSTLLLDNQKGIPITWPLFELCHQAFQNDSYVQLVLQEQIKEQEQKLNKAPVQKPEETNGNIIVVKNVNTKSSGDANVELMLNLYLRYSKNFQKESWRKGLWDTIAMELGEEDADYWHKRFLNFKQHYLRMIAKRETDGRESVNWPYMSLFDQIFENDEEFQKKYLGGSKTDQVAETTPSEIIYNDWNDTEMMILVKYHFDCFSEFQDETIPNDFLWNEVGRLLDKKAHACKEKYQELKKAHLQKYIEGGYSLRSRNPLAILFDNIISREVEIELESDKCKKTDTWRTEDLDELVQFLYENMEMFKDPICYYVCWASISKKFHETVHVCKKQWEDLKKLYKSILEDKKENPDMQIDWRYIELFDRIFDYGMDTNLLSDFKQYKEQNAKAFAPHQIGVKKVNIKLENDPNDMMSDDEEFDERGFTKRTKRGVGDSKAFKILEYYQKNKDKFSTTQRKKQALWETLAKQIGISGEQCAHRFRNLKQVYTAYVQREINKPEMPILWPYYALCKKVFGYRAIKSKLKNNKVDSEDAEEWAAKEIKQIINYFGNNFEEISNGADGDSSKWAPLAQSMSKSASAVNEKFLELQRSYRKLKTMKQNNPESKVSWKYYNLFDEVFARAGTDMVVEELEMEELTYDEEMVTEEYEKNESQDEEDYQCIIVIPEGQDISDISSSQIVIQQQPLENQETETAKPIFTKWTKRTKKKLLILYFNYVKARKGQEINASEMWSEISSKLPNKTPLSCRKMFAKLKANHVSLDSQDNEDRKKSPYYIVLQKILNMKPKFAKKDQSNSKVTKTYKDVLLPMAKVELALQYYLQHIEEFISPKFEKKYLWTELANFVSEPVNKLFNKINYLKQCYNIETDEVAGEKTLFGELLKEIIVKERNLKAKVDTEPIVIEEHQEGDWSDEETEQLLVWYLANLEKFKNPKFVRKYLWIEASSILRKSALACSKKMTEIRTQYKTMIKESPEELNSWRFYALCQKIYGTGKKNEVGTSGKTD